MKWLSELTSVIAKPFSGTTGCQVPLPTSPLGTFSLFTISLLQYIVLQSNQYALKCMGGEKFGRWMQMTIEELQAYMEFMVLIGIIHMPSVYDYWKRDPISQYTCSFQDL